ncbi:MAG: hypothetical protein QME16_06095 [Planctomycetota bacterium]|nr:hypothetical protein [Planctomycetota bacterium]
MQNGYERIYRQFCDKVVGSDKGIIGFYEPVLEYFNFDALWQNAAVKNRVVNVLKDFISSEVKDINSVTKIVGTDTVTINYSFGTLPIVGPLCDLLGKDLLIWSEKGNLATGGPKLFGRYEDRDEILIVHDFLRETIVLQSILNTIIAVSKCRINGIVVLVNIASKSKREQLAKFDNITYPIPIYSFISD